MRRTFGALLVLLPSQLLSWTTLVNISNTAMRSMSPAIAIDRTGHVHVVWSEEVRDNVCQILYCYYNGSSWSDSTNINPEGKFSGNVRIVADTLNHLHVTWTDFGPMVGGLYYVRHDGTTWGTPTRMPDVLPNTSALGTSDLVCDSLNNIHLVWSSHFDTGGENIEVFHTRFDGDTWSFPTNISKDPQASAVVSLAIDSQDHLHLVWMDYEGEYGVRYSEYDGSSWSPSVLLPDVSGGQSCDARIAIDTNDCPHVVWEERYGDYSPIVHVLCVGSNWSSPCTVSLLDESSYRPAISSDTQGRVCIVWNEKYAYYRIHENGTWSIPDSIPGSKNSGMADVAVDDNTSTLHVVLVRQRDVWHTEHRLTGIEESPHGNPCGAILNLISPNPFTGTTVITYQSLAISKHSQPVTLSIYDMVGRFVEETESRVIGRALPAGIYFVKAKGYEPVKMVKLR